MDTAPHQGLMVFKSLMDALRAGYQVYDSTPDGYLVRIRTSAGWALAIASCRSNPPTPQDT